MATMKRMGSDPLDMNTQDKIVTAIMLTLLVWGDQVVRLWCGWVCGGGVYLTVSQCRPLDRRPIHLVTVHPNLCLVGYGKDFS